MQKTPQLPNSPTPQLPNSPTPQLPNSPRHNSAFTLIELSIVLVIIGLIVGGVMVGRDLIRTSELRAIVSDIEKYDTAVQAFRLKYDALPGDMKDATDIWGSNDGITGPPVDAPGSVCGYSATGLYSPDTSTSTCNGDGDGVIFNGAVSTYTRNEYIYFWRHLQDAGFLNCNCTGLSYTSYADILPGYNSPLLPVGNGGGYGVISMWYLNSVSNHFYQINKTKGGHFFIVGMRYAQLAPLNSALTASDALYIDSKIDDGVPSTGTVQSPKKGAAWSPTCASNATASLAQYDVGTSGIICSLVVKASF